MTRLRLALVGLGAIGLNAHLPAILRNPQVELIAVVDPVESRRRVALERLPSAVAEVASLEDALASSEVQAVVLATPPWATPGLAVAAAQSGRFVLAEKPVATSIADAARYDRLTTAERGRIQVGLTYRHDPAMVRLREAIASGELGSPLLVRAHIWDERYDPSDTDHIRLIESTLEHGSPVIHEGAHVVDWLRYLLDGDPVVEDAWELRTRTGLANPNLVGARLRFPDGTVALLDFGWFTAALPACEISVLGDGGHARLDVSDFTLEITTTGGIERAVYPGDRTARSFDLQLERFVELCKGERVQPEPNLTDGIIALATSEVIANLVTQSLATGRAR